MNIFFFPRLARLVVALGVAAILLPEADVQAQGTYNWNTTSGAWDTSATNWSGSGSTWVNGSSNGAVFNNTATASTITLGEAITAGAVSVGNGGNNANYTFSGGSLSASSFTLQGAGSNDLRNLPTTSLTDTSVTLTGALTAGRARLVIGGSSTVTADTIGSPTGGDATGAWGQLTIQDTAVVTAPNGFSVGTTAWGLNLNGGTLITSGIQYSPHFFNGTTNLNFNGTLIRANQSNANFITVGPSGLDSGFNPDVQAGGARFDTNGFSIGITIPLSGAGGLAKSGAGTLTLGVSNTYSGGTIVNGGTLLLSHEPAGIANTAIGAMTSSNTVTITNGGTLTGSVNNWLSSTALVSGGSNAISVVVDQGGTLRGGNDRVTGLGNVTLNGGTIEVTTGLGAFGWDASFTLGGDITVSGSVASSITTAAGAGATANISMSNGSNGTGGTRTFTVNDVTSSAASDLLVSARLANGTVVKAGVGTLELVDGSTGTGTPVTWQVDAGRLAVNTAISSTVSIASGGTLGGSGSIAGPVTVLGTLSPGNSPGVITLGSLVLGGTSTTLIEIAGTSRGTAYDGVDITTSGGLTYGGLLSLDFSLLGSPVADNTTFGIFNFTGSSLGDFSSVTSTGVYSGTWTNLGSGTFALVSGAQTLTFSQATGDIVVVPEPASLAVFGLGLAMAAIKFRRRT